MDNGDLNGPDLQWLPIPARDYRPLYVDVLRCSLGFRDIQETFPERGMEVSREDPEVVSGLERNTPACIGATRPSGGLATVESRIWLWGILFHVCSRYRSGSATNGAGLVIG